MAIYRFRVGFEDYDDIYRDIEIKSSQTFKDFHTAIQLAIGFDGKHAASFFVSDYKWRKGTEITLLEEDLEEGVSLMGNVKIVSFVEDPHQHFVYVYDKLVVWSFHIQLTKILKDDITLNLPLCVKTMGIPPKQYKPTTLIKDEASSSENSFNTLLSDMNDEEAYRIAADKPEEIIDLDEVKEIVGEENNEDEESTEEGSDGESDEFGTEEQRDDER